jgi:hypothetical protein
MSEALCAVCVHGGTVSPPANQTALSWLSAIADCLREGVVGITVRYGPDGPRIECR